MVEVMVAVDAPGVRDRRGRRRIPSASQLTLTRDAIGAGVGSAEREMERSAPLPYSSVGLSFCPRGRASGQPAQPQLLGERQQLPDRRTTGRDTGSGVMVGTLQAGEPIWTSGGTSPPRARSTSTAQTADVFRYVTERRESCPINVGRWSTRRRRVITPGHRAARRRSTRSCDDPQQPADGPTSTSSASTSRRRSDTKRVMVAVDARPGNKAGVTRPVYMATMRHRPRAAWSRAHEGAARDESRLRVPVVAGDARDFTRSSCRHGGEHQHDRHGPARPLSRARRSGGRGGPRHGGATVPTPLRSTPARARPPDRARRVDHPMRRAGERQPDRHPLPDHRPMVRRIDVRADGERLLVCLPAVAPGSR